VGTPSIEGYHTWRVLANLLLLTKKSLWYNTGAGEFAPVLSKLPMSTPNTTSSKKCPTCGSPVSENATRCLVCGRALTPAPTAKAEKSSGVTTPRLPRLTLSLPIAIGLVILLIAIGAGTVYGVLSGTGRVLEPTQTPTVTITPTLTLTPTATLTSTPVPTATPEPPIEYTVKANDSCITIAVAFDVSVASIIVANNLDAQCTTLRIGQTLLIPRPTPTVTPLPTSTLGAAEATEAACTKISYTVTSNDTLSSIAANYAVPVSAIKEYNGMTSDIVYEGQNLVIPLCQRLPTPGPTPTPTPPPPYAAPNLLQPADGSAFTGADEVVALQWAAVGTLRENEAYAVTIEDVTNGNRKLVEYVNDTKYTVPTSFRPNDTIPHILRWYVVTVRQIGSSKDGQPIYEPAGAISIPRVFTWWSSASPTQSP